jgi:GNAT superfamily N-acetyltransferase
MPKFSRDLLEFERLAGPLEFDFDCRSPQQNDFLKLHAWNSQQQGTSVTYLLFHESELAGFVSVCMDEIRLGSREKPKDIGHGLSAFPAVKLAQMGVHHTFKGDDLGRLLINYAVLQALRTSEVIGCRFLTLDARPEKQTWYEDRGLVLNKTDQKERQERAGDKQIAVSMRIDLHDLPLEPAPAT